MPRKPKQTKGNVDSSAAVLLSSRKRQRPLGASDEPAGPDDSSAPKRNLRSDVEASDRVKGLHNQHVSREVPGSKATAPGRAKISARKIQNSTKGGSNRHNGATAKPPTKPSLKSPVGAKIPEIQKKATNPSKVLYTSCAKKGVAHGLKLDRKSAGADNELSASDSDSDGWESVEEAKIVDDDDEAGPSTSAPVEIVISLPNSLKKKEKDLEKLLLAQLRKRENEINMDTHKVHLLCYLAHGFYLNNVIGRNADLLSRALSLWENDVVESPESRKLDRLHLVSLVTSIKRHFPVVPGSEDDSANIISAIENAFNSKQCASYLHLVLVMLLMLRSLGLDVRLVNSMQPVSMKELKSMKISPGKGDTQGTSPYFSESKNEKPEKPQSAGKTGKGSPMAKTPKSSEKASKKSPKLKPVQKRKPCSEDEDSDVMGKRRKKRVPSSRKSNKNGSAAKELAKAKSVLGSVDLVGLNYWLEVYCSKLKNYVPIHCVNGDVGNYEVCEKCASQPIHYVVAFGEELSAKDVTAKYASNWLTVNRKLQIDVSWWTGTLLPHKPGNRKRNEEEDAATQEILLNRPRPKSVQEVKGHPLYVMRRHLLKYEGFYPLNPMPLYQINDEDVFLRDCVQLLHTRENWLKEARVVKPGEVPYKEVKKIQRQSAKSRKRDDPNADLMNAMAQKKEEMSGLFGRWQTEDYVPPIAKNGIVPRNQYGNVDLFKPSMLPIGCVHIPIKNIHRVARKLGIDCAEAMTGWDFSCGHCIPLLDGWIVCEEFHETLLDAWNTEQFEIEKEDKEKQSKKAVANWRKLIRGLIIRKKLQLKYGSGSASGEKKSVQSPVVVDIASDSE